MSKGQINHIFTYILIGIVVVLILAIGIKSIGDINKQRTSSELLLFKSQLESDFNRVASGSTEVFTYNVPAGVSEICFVDWYSHYLPIDPVPISPLVNDAIVSEYSTPRGQRNDIFIMINGMPDSMMIGNIILDRAYFQCFDTRDGTLKLVLSSTGTNVKVMEE